LPDKTEDDIYFTSFQSLVKREPRPVQAYKKENVINLELLSSVEDQNNNEPFFPAALIHEQDGAEKKSIGIAFSIFSCLRAYCDPLINELHVSNSFIKVSFNFYFTFYDISL